MKLEQIDHNILTALDTLVRAVVQGKRCAGDIGDFDVEDVAALVAAGLAYYKDADHETFRLTPHGIAFAHRLAARVTACVRCGAPAAYPGALYCGAACSAARHDVPDPLRTES